MPFYAKTSTGLTNCNAFAFFLSPLPFGGSTVFLLADQRGIEPPPAVCQRHKSAAIPTAPRGRRKKKTQCFCKSNRMAGSRGTPLLIQGLQPRLHNAHLCLLQAFAAWLGEVLILLRHCWRDAFFCVCVGSGSFCHDWALHCSVLFWSFDRCFSTWMFVSSFLLCGLIISGELLKQLEAFQASCRNSKSRVATRSNVWISRAHLWSCLLLK